MKDEQQDQRRVFGWALPGSLAVHAAVAALLIFGFPDLLEQPQKDEPIQVSLVPPPPEKPEVAPPPPPPPPPPEQAKVEPPPPPPPPEPEKPPEPPKPEKPPEEAKEEPRPVENFAPPLALQFGEKDSGPKLSLDGTATEEPAKTEPKEQSEPTAPQDTPEETPAEAVKTASPPETPETPAPPAEAADTPAPSEPAVAPEEAAKTAAEAEEAVDSKSTEDAAPTPAEPTPAAEPPPVMAVEPEEEVKLPQIATAPTPKPVELAAKSPDKAAVDAPAKAKKPPVETNKQAAAQANADARVKQASKPKNLEDIVASLQTNDAPSATTAMGNLNRGERAGRLCYTRLVQRLRNSSFNPDYLPYQDLTSGNVLDVRNVGFSVGDKWYDLSYRCTVDEGATRVVSFDAKIGGLVPRSEWKRRRFPTQ